LIVDGRPEVVRGSLFGPTRARTGEVTDFELLWEIPIDAAEVELEVTGSTGDTTSVAFELPTLPLVLGE
jgi:hypothetical protein